MLDNLQCRSIYYEFEPPEREHNMKQICDFIIFDIPDTSQIDMEMVEKIATHTKNTWQPERPLDEIRNNTLQGKRAEYVIEKYLAENSSSRYLSYDGLRRDNFAKHAPFDGIVYKADIDPGVLNEGNSRINDNVIQGEGDFGQISVETREFLEQNGMYTIEIKSSMLQNPRDYRTMIHKHPGTRTEGDYMRLCEYIRKFYDYFIYPHYCRDDLSISNFYGYSKKVETRKELRFSKNKSDFLWELIEDEFNNACIVYTRVFFDLLSNEILVPGYILKTRFFEEPRIQKMPSLKSKNALYYMYHMKYGKSFSEFDTDTELWNWNRENERAMLFDTKSQLCPTCGGKLRLVDVKSRSKYLYVCDRCPAQHKWVEMSRIYRRNL